MGGAVYRLGAALHDLKDPSRVLGVADEWILEPEDPWERVGYVHNVVFCCGAVPEDDGTLKVYDNPIGVITNSPPFDWHIANLHNYINLTAFNAPPLKLAGVEFSQFGQGSGLLGLPGDGTPPSRFVRAVFSSLYTLPMKDAEAAVRRERQEETGHMPRQVKRLGGFYSAPGFCTEYLHLYLVSDLTPSRLFAEDTESIEVVRVPMSQIPDLLASGKIQDAKSVAGLLTFLCCRRARQG